MEKLTAYEQAIIMTTLDNFPLKKALASILNQLPVDKLEAAEKYIKTYLIKF